MRRYVFVSHANEDKARLRPLVEALLDAGIPLWIDRPEEMGLGERHLRCGRIVAGADWQQEIRSALENACCVLFVLSRAANSFKRSDELIREFNHAKARDKLVMTQIDPIDRAELNPFFRVLQTINLVPAGGQADAQSLASAKLEVVVERLREHLQAEQRPLDLIDAGDLVVPPLAHGFAAPGPAKGAGGDRTARRPPRLLPYLVDRRVQQSEVGFVLHKQREDKSIRPTTFFIVGSNDDCVDMFVEKMHRTGLPEFLAANDLFDTVNYKLLEWPGEDAHTVRSKEEGDAQFLDIRTQVHRALDVPLSNPAMLQRRLTTSPVCHCFHINIGLDQWGPGQRALLRRWLEWWGAIDISQAAMPVVSFVSIIHPGAKFSLLGGSGRLSMVRRDVRALKADPKLSPVMHVLPELGMVRFEDVEHWIREHVETVDPEDLRRRVRRHFSGVFSVGRKRLSMYRTAALMKAELSQIQMQGSAP